MGQDGNMEYRFGPYTLEPAQRRISGDGNARIELTAKAFDLFVLLVSRSGQLVTKDEILDEIWQDVSIAESNITTTISMIRRALREDSEHQYIETVPKKGYRFTAPVTSEVTGARSTKEPPQAATVPVAPRRASFGAGLSACGSWRWLYLLLASAFGFGIRLGRLHTKPYCGMPSNLKPKAAISSPWRAWMRF